MLISACMTNLRGQLANWGVSVRFMFPILVLIADGIFCEFFMSWSQMLAFTFSYCSWCHIFDEIMTHISRKTRKHFTPSKICIYLFLFLIFIRILHEVFFSKVKMQHECPLSHQHGAPERQGCMGGDRVHHISSHFVFLLAIKLRVQELWWCTCFSCWVNTRWPKTWESFSIMTLSGKMIYYWGKSPLQLSWSCFKVLPLFSSQ